MKSARIFLASVFLASFGSAGAMADCQIADAKLEEAILQKPELRGAANRQKVRDLRILRDAAFTLWSYGRHEDCQRLVANIRELVFAPSMGNLGDNDEEEAENRSPRENQRCSAAQCRATGTRKGPSRSSVLTNSPQ